MTIHLSNRKFYKKNHSYAKKMTYTVSVFGASYDDYKRICKDKKLNEKNVIWYKNEDIQPKRFRKRKK